MTTDRQNDVEDLIAALRDDLPSGDDERRVRTRLMAGGMAVGSLTVAQLGSAAAAGNAAASSTAASSTVVASGAASATAAGGGILAGSSAVGSSAAGSLSIAAGTAAGTQGLAAVFVKTALVTALAVGAGYPVVSQLLPPAAPAPAAAALVESKIEGVAKPALAVEPAQLQADRRPAEAEVNLPLQQAAVSTRLTRTPEPRAVWAAQARATSTPEGTGEQNTVARSSTLEAETALIERALRAARLGDNDSALRWLSEHQYHYPNGALAPERQRALDQLRRQ